MKILLLYFWSMNGFDKKFNPSSSLTHSNKLKNQSQAKRRKLKFIETIKKKRSHLRAAISKSVTAKFIEKFI